MFPIITAATKAAAPHVGKALVKTGIGLASTAVTIKASTKAQESAVSAVKKFEDAGRAAKTAVSEVKVTNVTDTKKAQERKVS